MKRYALTRAVGSNIRDCQLSYVGREPIDVQKARRQHAAYRAVLSELGVEVITLSYENEHPDGVFVEDAAVVFDEVAVMCRPGAESRRLEIRSVSAALVKHRRLEYIFEPGLLDGGDVLTIGKDVYVGLSSRSNQEAVFQLKAILTKFDYNVRPVRMQGCLHLKTACTYLGWSHLLANPHWVDLSQFEKFQIVQVDPSEPFAANSLALRQKILYPSCFPKTQRKIESKGFETVLLDISELQKAEAGLTCLSIIWKNYAER